MPRQWPPVNFRLVRLPASSVCRLIWWATLRNLPAGKVRFKGILQKTQVLLLNTGTPAGRFLNVAHQMRRHTEEAGNLTNLKFTGGHCLGILWADADILRGKSGLEDPEAFLNRTSGDFFEVLLKLIALLFR